MNLHVIDTCAFKHIAIGTRVMLMIGN